MSRPMPKEKARAECACDELRLIRAHELTPCRMTQTVAMPKSMKVHVAARERVERRDNPQTP